MLAESEFGQAKCRKKNRGLQQQNMKEQKNLGNEREPIKYTERAKPTNITPEDPIGKPRLDIVHLLAEVEDLTCHRDLQLWTQTEARHHV